MDVRYTSINDYQSDQCTIRTFVHVRVQLAQFQDASRKQWKQKRITSGDSYVFLHHCFTLYVNKHLQSSHVLTWVDSKEKPQNFLLFFTKRHSDPFPLYLFSKPNTNNTQINFSFVVIHINLQMNSDSKKQTQKEIALSEAERKRAVKNKSSGRKKTSIGMQLQLISILRSIHSHLFTLSLYPLLEIKDAVRQSI